MENQWYVIKAKNLILSDFLYKPYEYRDVHVMAGHFESNWSQVLKTMFNVSRLIYQFFCCRVISEECGVNLS